MPLTLTLSRSTGRGDLERLRPNAIVLAPMMRGAGGLRKIRFAPPSMRRGKSGATRVGFAYFRSRAAIVVVAMFSKNEAANFTAAQRAGIAKWLKDVERSLK